MLFGLFIITGIVMSIFVGGFMTLLTVAQCHFNTILKTILCIIVSLTIGFSIAGILFLEQNNDITSYNDGICLECGGIYHLSATTKGTRTNVTTYYWECDTCRHILKTTSNVANYK